MNKHAERSHSMAKQDTKYVISKAVSYYDADGMLTREAMQIVQKYASLWCMSFTRDLALEKDHPELDEIFYDVRHDPQYAMTHAVPLAQ